MPQLRDLGGTCLKFIMFFEGKASATEAKEKRAKMAELGKTAKAEGHTPAKVLSESYLNADGSRDFRILETDDVENLVGIVAHYGFEKCKFIPIIETGRAIELAEELMEHK